MDALSGFESTPIIAVILMGNLVSPTSQMPHWLNQLNNGLSSMFRQLGSYSHLEKVIQISSFLKIKFILSDKMDFDSWPPGFLHLKCIPSDTTRL